jgi:hypothetical protein
MDADILEGLPSTEDLGADTTTPTNIKPTSEGIPAAPVDAASVEPEPQVVATVNEESPVGVPEKVASPEKAPEPAAVKASPSVEVTSREKGDLPKTSDDKVGAASATPGFQVAEGPRVDVSAATVARMMGIASTNDLRVIEGRVDLLTSKVAAILTKMDRCLSMFSSIPTASDIGRLEVQLAAVKSMMKELLDSVGAPVGGAKDQADKQVAAEQSRKLRDGIKTNTES